MYRDTAPAGINRQYHGGEATLYGQRLATVEPVFGHLRHNKQLNRFTLRGRKKVDAQWKPYCMVHNIEKLAHHGYAQSKMGWG
jgi:hypothetical protein